MARTKRSTDLDTRNKRLELQVGKRFMETLGPGRYLSYKRPTNGGSGSWIARGCRINIKPLKFRQTLLGAADDFLTSDGIGILSFAEAQKKAEILFEEWAREAVQEEGGEVPHKGPFTVRDAWAEYIADAEIRGVHGIRIMTQSAEAHILPDLGNIDLAKLTLKKVRDWHQSLSTVAKRKTGARRKEGEEVQHLAGPVTEDEKRARKDTANRILTNLKAALNFAAKSRGLGRATDWRGVKPFAGVVKARIRFLTVDEQQRLVNACPDEFRALVKGALFTGARYGELTKVLVKDLNPQGSLFLEFGKSNTGGYKSRHVILTKEGLGWFVSYNAGRKATDLMFQRTGVIRGSRAEALKDFAGWAAYDQRSAMEAACIAAEIPAVTFHELRHTYASSLVNRGVPLAYVAEQLGHSNTRMVERHYGHLCPSAKADSIRLLAPVLGFGGEVQVQPLEIKKG